MNKNAFFRYWASQLLPKLILTLAVFSTAILQAQNTVIKGTVTDNVGTLSGVTVIIKGTTTGTLTDIDGNFQISAQPNDILLFSYLGYQTQEVPINNSTIIKIKLQEDTTTLKEVIVNAGYYTVKDKERTGSIARVTSKDIENQPVPNILATMQGRMAGVNIVQETGIAGGGFKINIRGVNSLREDANNPLYIIDGVPYSTDAISDLQTSTSTIGNGNPLASINPNDIQSIEVLKGESATKRFGEKAKNGAIIITLKKDKQEE
mgnify:FL=1